MKDETQKREPRKSDASSNLPASRLRELVGRAQEGDLDAFQELYSFYGRKILNYLYRMTGSREEAEDLAQDTFILAFRNLGSLKHPERFQSWLFRIAQNNVYQKYRGKRPQIESIDEEDFNELSDLQRLSTPSKGPEEAVLSDELEALVQQAISELPEKYRTVFVLSAIQKMSYQRISEIVGRSLASVKSDIHRARVEVRDKIKKYLGKNYGMSKL
ncbi:MAG TPA: sigma-70 family RNA polymerase sigma factor [Acidobacteriota bacterium]|nr:sigma-70 family RNA polymerase sigma factor [Acidobacteriota bacterium]